MCRFVLYLGPEVLVSSVVTEPTHGLLEQSLKATDPKSVSVNADGFGLAWYALDISPIPACYKDITPAWNNQNLKQITRVVKSTCIFAHVRAASTGVVVQTNCHPFCYRNVSFMHNGTVPYFTSIKKRMLNSISESAYDIIQGTTDSEMIFALFVTFYERFAAIQESGEELKEVPYSRDRNTTRYMADALKATLHHIHRLVLEHESESESMKKKKNRSGSIDIGSDSDTSSVCSADGAEPICLPYSKAIGRLNLAITDGHTSIATRYVCTDPSQAHSLYYSRGTRPECDGQQFQGLKNSSNVNQSMLLVCSEPLGTCYEYEMVPANHMVVADDEGYFCIESCL